MLLYYFSKLLFHETSKKDAENVRVDPFLLLALCGIGILGVVPLLNKDNKLFAYKIEMAEENSNEKEEWVKLKS